ncbi:MAG: DEAD/DEAH box helicase [Alphaproteobacteria bacterium]|nr:DEAD/DEAH box helicase [Alphaproteobacteria bacterium]
MPFPTLNAALERALTARGYAEPTSVQEAVLAAEAGRDLLVSARTGSGKTVAFGLAMATELLGEAERVERGGAPLVLVIAPTRELAQQVQGELEWLYAEAGARVVSCVGGMDPRAESRLMAQGCHIVVGTPGRLRDHIERNQLDLSALRVAVLDEADEMLDLGFREDLEFILNAAPQERRTLLFSATFAREIVGLARAFQRDAIRIDTVDRSRPHEDIEYRAIRSVPGEDFGALVNVLRAADSRALVFCATREGVKTLLQRLLGKGFAAVALSGELSQAERNASLAALRDSRAEVCVATDVAARGLDLPELDLVVHYDLPNGPEALLHRSGRTGRAGRKGVCALIVQPRARRRAEQLLMAAKVSVQWVSPPAAEEIRAADRARLARDPVFAMPVLPAEGEEAAALLAEHGPEAVALALLRLHRARMPAPAELSAPPAERGERIEMGATKWFRINLGRQKNADPKWMLPLLCRLGGVTRKDIGAIRIQDRETLFELAPAAVEGFLASLETAEMEGMRIAPASAEDAATPQQERPRAPYQRHDGPRPEGKRPYRPRHDAAPAEAVLVVEPPHAHVPALVVQAEAGRPEAPRSEAPRSEPPRSEAPRPEAPRPHAPRQDSPRQDGPRQDGPRQFAGKPGFGKKPGFAKKPGFGGKPKFAGKPQPAGKPSKPHRKGTKPARVAAA